MNDSLDTAPDAHVTDRRDPLWMRGLAVLFLILGLGGGTMIGLQITPQWLDRYDPVDVQTDEQGELFRVVRDEPRPVEETLTPEQAEALVASDPGAASGQIVAYPDGSFREITTVSHLGFWSLLPAVVAIGLCLTTREPMVSLLIGVVTAALMLAQYDITGDVLQKHLASPKAALVLLLYMWLLGGLMGVWSRSGAARAFADWASKSLVKGPRSAKLVAWGLGILFFQGGTVSTVLVGTSVKPIADKEKVSHEELSYVVDSTASPIAVLLAFNAWPLYVQGLIFVPGVALLATAEDRMAFFFDSIWLSFYAWFAVLGTLLLALDKLPFIGRGMKAAMKRSRETGQLDRPGSQPMSAKELEASDVPAGFTPSMFEFIVPIVVLLTIAIGTYVLHRLKVEWVSGVEVMWAFSAALLVAAGSALARGMTLKQLMDGIGNGLKGVVVATVILLLATVLGVMMKETGGGAYLVDALGGALPYWILPAALLVLTMIVAFSTGTSWGTFAVTFPLAMPLAWALGQNLDNPELYLAVCFATVLNGSVYGDQCSPISDTTILSSMTTGADLMDHVKTQLVPASVAAGLALVCWQVIVVVFC